jgi:hypothetical protein
VVWDFLPVGQLGVAFKLSSWEIGGNSGTDSFFQVPKQIVGASHGVNEWGVRAVVF